MHNRELGRGYVPLKRTQSTQTQSSNAGNFHRNPRRSLHLWSCTNPSTKDQHQLRHAKEEIKIGTQQPTAKTLTSTHLRRSYTGRKKAQNSHLTLSSSRPRKKMRRDEENREKRLAALLPFSFSRLPRQPPQNCDRKMASLHGCRMTLPFIFFNQIFTQKLRKAPPPSHKLQISQTTPENYAKYSR